MSLYGKGLLKLLLDRSKKGGKKFRIGREAAGARPEGRYERTWLEKIELEMYNLKFPLRSLHATCCPSSGDFAHARYGDFRFRPETFDHRKRHLSVQLDRRSANLA